jgi:hypothetical protein
MANQHRTKLRGVRNVDDQLWDDFEKVADALDSDRSAEIRRYIEWAVRRPGAEGPRRPAVPEPGDEPT